MNVKEKILKNGDIILIFPKDAEIQDCIQYSKRKNLNPFIIGETAYGRPRFVCAYSWKLGYFNKFGTWPQ